MRRNLNLKQYQKILILLRQLNGSLVGKNSDGTINRSKLFSHMNTFYKTKMPMQNYSKLLVQIKDHLQKTGQNKNLQLVLSKDWIELLQKVVNKQLDSLKGWFPIEFQKNTKNGKQSNIKKCDKDGLQSEKTALIPQEGGTSTTTSTKQLKVNQEQSQEATTSDQKPEIKEDSYALSQILDNLIFKLTNKAKEDTTLVTPKWKTNVQKNVPKHSIACRTRHILNSIRTAESNASRWRRVDDLLTHMDQYPEARHYAIKEGAIKDMLKMRSKLKDEQIKASVREALAILGYVDPLPGRGIRILSIDGGGMRGVLVIEMLKKLEELTGRRTHEMFDYICGVSTGAILATVLGGHKRKSLNEISELYKDLSTKIFTQNTIKGTSKLVWSHAYYDTALWEILLQEHLGDKILIKTARDPNAPKFSAISAIVNHARVMAYVFRNYTFPERVQSQYLGSYKHKLWEAVRASAAAPSYFEEFKYGEFLHQDGGILVNNPCAIGLHEAKQLWPNNPIQCIISFGTGRISHKISENNTELTEIAISSWKEKFYKILDSATDTEAVHTMLSDLLPEHVYFRFNPYLTEMLSMTEIRPEKISQLEQDAKVYIGQNEEKFHKAAQALLEKRQMRQRIMDWIMLQKQTSNL